MAGFENNYFNNTKFLAAGFSIITPLLFVHLQKVKNCSEGVPFT